MEYGAPTKLPDGRYFLKVTKNGGRMFQQVNNVRLAVDGTQVTIEVPSTLFSEIDEQIVTQAKESKVAWFGKEISDETVVSAYQKSVNPESELLASYVTFKGKVVTTFYDSQKNQVELDPTSGPVDVLLELSGLVFTKRAFEPVWKVVQVRLRAEPKPKFPREYLFKDDPVDEEDDVDL
jgi:hypothetical protein